MYIVNINSKSFIKMQDNNTVIVSDIKDSTKFDTIGDAMRVAAMVNNDFEEDIASITYINK